MEPKKQTLTIEAGKYYRTRSGRTAFVAAVTLPNPNTGENRIYPALGYIEGRDETWKLSGANMSGRTHDDDLVAEWVEPKRIKGWISVAGNISKHDPIIDGKLYAGSLTIWPTRQEAIEGSTGALLACIEIDVLEGDGLGEVA